MLEEIVKLSLLLNFIVHHVHGLVIMNNNELSLVQLSDNAFVLRVNIHNSTKTFNLKRRQENIQTLIADEDESLSPIHKSVSLTHVTHVMHIITHFVEHWPTNTEKKYT